MSLKEKIYNVFPFIPRNNLFWGQKIYSLKVSFNKQQVFNDLKKKTNLYANIGCGEFGLTDGWINIDFGDYPNVTHNFDCRKELPFAEGSVRGIYTEHFFEHLDYNNEVPFFLQSSYNALAHGGILRIVVPDAEKYLLGYAAEGWSMLKETRPLDDNLIDELMGFAYESKMQLINEVFRQGGEHKYAWDFETMKISLLKAGFSEAHKMEYRKSHDEQLAIDREIRRPESLYVEAIR